MHQSQAHAAAVSRLRSYLKLNRGHRAGCLKLLDAMLQHDSMNTGILNWKEFSHALTSSGCQIQDVKVLYQFEIKDENGCINIQNFLEMIKNKLSKQKEELIIEVFYNSIDKDADGIVSINDILSNYVVDQHPDVKIGRKSAETILHDLSNDLAFFSQDGYYNIKSFTSFIDYIYSFEDDVDFHELVTSLWIQPQPHAKIDNVASSISSQGFGSSLLHAKEVFVDKIRKCLRVRGLKGCCTLKTSLLKRGGDGKLSLLWFKRALKEASMTFPDSFMSNVFFLYDDKKKGYVSSTHILQDIMMVLSEESQELVNALFHSLDVSNENILSIDYISRHYDADNHPDVTNGRKKGEEEYRDFLSCFDAGSEIPHKVTNKEFQEYFKYVRVVCGSDEMLERIIRSAWHLTDEVIEQYRVSLTKLDPIEEQVLKTKDVLDRYPLPTTTIKGTYTPKQSIEAARPRSDDDPRGGVPFLLKKIRAELFHRGLQGLLSFQRVLRSYDIDEDGKLNLGQLTCAVKESFPGMLTDNEVRLVFDYLDANYERLVSVPSMMSAFRSPLGDKARRLLAIAFDRLDKSSSGVASAHDVAAGYKAANHPDVESGRRTAEEETHYFLDMFEVGGEVEGCVTRSEFMSYFANLGAALNDEAYFCQIVGNTWLDPNDYELFELNYTRRIDVNDMRSSLPTVNNSFVSREPYNIISLEQQAHAHVSTTTAAVKDNFSIYDGQTQLTTSVSGGVKYLLQKASAVLLTGGKAAVHRFEKRLRLADGNHDDKVNLSQFCLLMKEVFPGLFTDNESRAIFNSLESGRSAYGAKANLLDISVVMDAFRTPLSEKGLRIVSLAFDGIDKEGRGVVPAHEIAAAYDPSRHPEVIAGRRSVEEEYHDFLDGFEVGGKIDGCVTRPEFISYFANEAAAFDDEDYFIELIANTWLGQGVSHNTQQINSLSNEAPPIPTIGSSLSIDTSIEPQLKTSSEFLAITPSSNRRRYQGGDDSRSKSELTNAYIFGRMNQEAPGKILNLHHHHHGVVFPPDENLPLPPPDKHGKKHIKLRKSDVIFLQEE